MRRETAVSLRFVALLAALAAWWTPPAVVAAAQEAAGIELIPARAEVDQTHRQIDLTFTMVNHDETVHEVEVRLTGLGHDLDGTPQFDGPAPDTLRLNRSELRLPPGGRGEVQVLGHIPDGQAGVYAGLLAQVPASSRTGSDGSSIGIETRVGGFIMVRGPRPWDETVEVDEVSVVATPGGYELMAIVADRGDVHVRPEGTIELRDADGTASTVQLPGETILPGYARRLVVPWEPPPGFESPFEAVVDVGEPGGDARHQLTLPSRQEPALEIVSLTGRRDAESTPVVDVDIRNAGSQDLEVLAGRLELLEGPGGLSAGPFMVSNERLGAGSASTMSFVLDPGLPAGPWRAQVTVTSGPLSQAAEATLTFPDGAGSVAGPVEPDPIERQRQVLIPIASTMVVALLVIALVLLVGRRREPDEDRSASAEAEGDVVARM